MICFNVVQVYVLVLRKIERREGMGEQEKIKLFGIWRKFQFRNLIINLVGIVLKEKIEKKVVM